MPVRNLLVALLLLLASSAHAAPVVAVLYFDNHTNDARYDVLRKGLADMLVTDLTGAGVTVVERERLQTLFDEQKLQASTFIDDQTAVGTGKGLGATHVLTGSLVAVAPTLRIDARVVDVATGKVVVAASVSGAADSVFTLEQALVGDLTRGLAVTFVAAPLPVTKVKDLPTLVDYSKALDLADRGELGQAKDALDALVSKAPTFGLARLTREALVKRLTHSIDRRVQARGAAEDEIVRLAKADDATLYVRMLAGCVQLRKLLPLLSDPKRGTWLPGKRAAVETIERAWVASQRALIAAVDRETAQHRADLFFDLDETPAEAKLRAIAELDRSRLDAFEARAELGRFLLLGESWSCGVSLAPALAMRSPELLALGEATMAEAVALADARSQNPVDAYAAREQWGDYYWRRGDVERAVAKWQEALDRYPSAPAFARLERRIKKLLGLERDSYVLDLASWQRGLTTCLDRGLRASVDAAFHRAFVIEGTLGVEHVFDQAHAACASSRLPKSFWAYLAKETALEVGKHRYCERFEHYMNKSLAWGGSASEVAAYRQNYTQCPAP